MPKSGDTLLEMAVVGYESELSRITAKTADIKAQLDHAVPAKRRSMSKSTHARIAAAQRARWAAQKNQQAQPATPAKTKKAA